MPTTQIPQYLQDRFSADTSLHQAIQQSLNVHGVRPDALLLYLQSKPGYPNDGNKSVPALHIIVDAGEANPFERWSAARRDVTALLDDHGFDEIEVEIQDPERFYQPSLFPIHPNHPAVSIYKSVREELLARIHDSIGSVWNSLCLLEVGRAANLKKPTIVIMVDPLAERDWGILKASLEAVINRKGLPPGKLPVEIMPGGCADDPPNPRDLQSRPGKSFLDDFETHPHHGTSISVRGEIGGGTLGGYFLMKSPTETHKGFLTNSHVVAPASTESPSAILEYDLLGLSYTAPSENAGRTWVYHFAPNDVDATRKHAEQRLQSLKPELANIDEQLKQRKESGASPQAGLVSLRAQMIQQIEQTESRLSQVKTMPRLQGRTIVASGRRLTHEMKTLDYAFVETSSIGNNRLPTDRDFGNREARPEELGIGALNLLLPEVCRSFTTIRPGRWYFKSGRTTGLTSGICNGVEAWIRPTAQHTLFDARGAVLKVRRFGRKLQVDEETGRLKYDEKGKPMESEDEDDVHYASEWVIVNATIDGRTVKNQQAFCDKGDSGSLLVDNYGRVAGILWGDVTGYCGPLGKRTIYSGAGLVNDIDDVKASLKTQLGWSQDANVDCLQLP
ncbi:MAG: hypothetical protein Q9191_004630 [Dirinaria sp. TL-2023a]